MRTTINNINLTIVSEKNFCPLGKDMEGTLSIGTNNAAHFREFSPGTVDYGNGVHNSRRVFSHGIGNVRYNRRDRSYRLIINISPEMGGWSPAADEAFEECLAYIERREL